MGETGKDELRSMGGETPEVEQRDPNDTGEHSANAISTNDERVLTESERLAYLLELNSLASMMSAMFMKPQYGPVKKNGQREVIRTIQSSMYSFSELWALRQRADELCKLLKISLIPNTNER